MGDFEKCPGGVLFYSENFPFKKKKKTFQNFELKMPPPTTILNHDVNQYVSNFKVSLKTETL
jgi:hypothetical protein